MFSLGIWGLCWRHFLMHIFDYFCWILLHEAGDGTLSSTFGSFVFRFKPQFFGPMFFLQIRFCWSISPSERVAWISRLQFKKHFKEHATSRGRASKQHNDGAKTDTHHYANLVPMLRQWKYLIFQNNCPDNMLVPPGGVCPAWNKVDWDNMSWVSATVCCSCSHGVDLTVFFHIKCGCSQEDFISCFQMQLIIECFDYVQTWFFFAKSGGKINNHL